MKRITATKSCSLKLDQELEAKLNTLLQHNPLVSQAALLRAALLIGLTKLSKKGLTQ